MPWSRALRKRLLLVLFLVVLAGMLLPEPFAVPVKGAQRSSYNQKSFWYHPWGKSGTHKGVDIFAAEGTPVLASVPGFVLYSGELDRGGNVVLLLGPKWRLHYFAHLAETTTTPFSLTRPGTPIGTVGTTGNAKGKAPHLHYSITTLLPRVWKVDGSPQGWKKMFYLDPIPLLNGKY